MGKGKGICGKSEGTSPFLPEFERERCYLWIGRLCFGEKALMDCSLSNVSQKMTNQMGGAKNGE
jgi:hypothetical protein